MNTVLFPYASCPRPVLNCEIKTARESSLSEDAFATVQRVWHNWISVRKRPLDDAICNDCNWAVQLLNRKYDSSYVYELKSVQTVVKTVREKSDDRRLDEVRKLLRRPLDCLQRKYRPQWDVVFGVKKKKERKIIIIILINELVRKRRSTDSRIKIIADDHRRDGVRGRLLSDSRCQKRPPRDSLRARSWTRRGTSPIEVPSPKTITATTITGGGGGGGGWWARIFHEKPLMKRARDTSGNGFSAHNSATGMRGGQTSITTNSVCDSEKKRMFSSRSSPSGLLHCSWLLRKRFYYYYFYYRCCRQQPETLRITSFNFPDNVRRTNRFSKSHLDPFIRDENHPSVSFGFTAIRTHYNILYRQKVPLKKCEFTADF